MSHEDLFTPLGTPLLQDPRDLRLRDQDETSDIALVGIPWDWKTAGDPGSRHAPRQIIQTMLSLPVYSPKLGAIPRKPRLYGNINVWPGDWERTQSVIKEASKKLFDRHPFVLFIGGDHSVSGPILEALAEEKGGIGLLMLDAHYDLRSVEKGVTSGSWLWEVATKPWVNISATIIGIGEYSNPPYLHDRAERLGFKVISALEVHENISQALEAIDWLADQSQDAYYITLDMDHISEAFAPGVNSPSTFGLEPWQTALILDYAVKKLHPIGADIVEVVPVKDIAGRTVRLAAQFAMRFAALGMEVLGE